MRFVLSFLLYFSPRRCVSFLRLLREAFFFFSSSSSSSSSVLKGLVLEIFFIAKFFLSRQGAMDRSVNFHRSVIIAGSLCAAVQVATGFSRLSPGRRMKVDLPFTTTRKPDITRA